MLSEHDLRRIGEALESALYRGTYDLIARARTDVIDELRFAPLAAEISEARGRRGLDIKAAAKLLKVPQYVIQSIERGSVAELRPGLLERYAAALGMADELERWQRANPELALRLADRRGNQAS